MDELRQPVFSVGLKGVDPANADKVSPDWPAPVVLYLRVMR